MTVLETPGAAFRSFHQIISANMSLTKVVITPGETQSLIFFPHVWMRQLGSGLTLLILLLLQRSSWPCAPMH
jgi:hypothetical protein